jgi:DNA polymerase-1
MIDIDRELRDRALRTRMILTVHDELLFEAPEDEAADAAALVRQTMEGAVALKVPLTVDVGTAANWRDAKD